MSDRLKDLSNQYEEEVLVEEHPRSIGLFTIPEYPELEVGQGMWSVAFDVILTTLRYLAPATILTLFWGQQSFIFKLLKHVDTAIRSIIFSSEEQKQEVLKWVSEEGPVRVENLDSVWRQGWILCGVLDQALPGACAGHPQTSLSLKHAQAIADHYLGVEPVFSRQELDSNDALGKHQEWKLATYLDRIRQALSKLTPPVSKPNSQRTSPETTQYTLDYIVKGSGLKVAQVNNKMHFKVYPTSQQCVEPGEITILIRGPKNSYGMTVLPPILGKAQIIRQKLLGMETKPNFTESILPLTQGATYYRNYGKNDMNKTYYIPKAIFDIDIEIESNIDYAKIGYVVKHEGTYEISITSRGQNVVGSPFYMKASKNMISILEKEAFCLEDGEEIDVIDEKTDRKVVLRIVDFVTEKMLLRDNGSLEKISEDEAKVLMATDKTGVRNIDKESFATKVETNRQKRLSRFRNMASKIIILKRVCLIFNDLLTLKKQKLEKLRDTTRKPKQNIPDIVNSIIHNKKSNILNNSDRHDHNLLEKKDKFIIPQNISVSICTEKPKSSSRETKEDENNTCPKLKISEKGTDENMADINLKKVTPNTSNPFYSDMYKQDNKTNKYLTAFVADEYEESVKTSDSPIEILLSKTDMTTTTSQPTNSNPFLEPDIINLERPKTPILKIISGEIINRDDSGYINPNSKVITDELLDNEFINPFFVHQHLQEKPEEKINLTTDFIIGAPVSLPPIMKSSTPEPTIQSIISSSARNYCPDIREDVNNIDEERTQTTSNGPCDNSAEDLDSPISSFQSLDTDSMPEKISCIKPTNEFYNVPIKKEIWDSAYVSIDDNNSSPDSNNNESNIHFEIPNKDENYRDLTNVGPAEREIWESEFNRNVPKQSEEVKFGKIENKRPIFTPIIEENDKSITTTINQSDQQSSSKNEEPDYVSVAFAELNNIYKEYFPEVDKTSSDITSLRFDNQNLENNYLDGYIPEHNVVNSASELQTDVMRHINIPEGMISEVQPNVTESSSASQGLHFYETIDRNFEQHTDETQFGNSQTMNIVQQKKKFWDDKIRQIQAAKSEENTNNQKKRRPFSKPLKHNDSLTKKKGKNIVKNFLNAGETVSVSQSSPITTCNQDIHHTSLEDPVKEKETDEKLVVKWKKYWNKRLETQNNVADTVRDKTSPQKLLHHKMPLDNTDTEQENCRSSRKLSPVKQELSEEVFKAFETSPKRFFGTSRKQILNKIDSFLGKPNTLSTLSNFNNLGHDSGLVSSRISLFHSITNTEELPLQRRKCQSLQDIQQRNNTKTIDSPNETCHRLPTNNKGLEIIQTDQPTLKEKMDTLTIEQHNKNLQESLYFEPVREKIFIKNSAKTDSQRHRDSPVDRFKQQNTIRKTNFSKSETDLFNKITKDSLDNELDKYKSCEELPKINVKNFISLYETVTKTAADLGTSRKSLKKDFRSPNNAHNHSSHSGAVNTHAIRPHSTPNVEIKKCDWRSSQSNIKFPNKKMTSDNKSSNTDISVSSIDTESTSQDASKNITYLSLSDIELEIIENSSDKSKEPTPERDPNSVHAEYKSRFKMAKQYFQSLEELREERRPSKLNECEILLYGKKTNESPVEDEQKRPQKRVKKNIKSHSMPSSEISKIWNQMQETQESKPYETKPVKISEKFNVDDLFSDVMEGRLSRQGSLRGIPHKKAVLETFRSMENVSNNKLNSYEISDTQLSELTADNNVHRNAQTFLTEYPYLPTTDPSKYHSRLDAKASGLISMKELRSNKPRRNSVPDLRLNPAFTANL